MTGLLGFACLVLICFQVAEFSDPVPAECRIELECEECVPDNMPLVTSHGGSAAAAGAVVTSHGARLALSCGAGHFVLYPRASLAVTCEAGQYRVAHDRSLRRLLDLGCQESVFEDVEHQVEHCAPPLQGRAYQTRAEGGGAARHLATVCFDADRAVAVRLRASSAALALPPHADGGAPLSLLGNFQHMFDASLRHEAERLYSDDARLNRRLRELFRHERFAFAGQALTSARLLAPHYFEERYARAAEFASNRVPVWGSVAAGNLRHLQADVAEYVKRARGAGAGAGEAPLEVYAGTHGVLSLNTGAARAEVYLKGGRRFPVPRYIWTAVVAPARRRGVALVLLNDPFVSVSEIRAAVFCESSCGAVSWLAELTRHRNYERPLNGLLFCCNLRDFTAVVPEMPRIFNGSIELLN